MASPISPVTQDGALEGAHVVLCFHKGDQRSAQWLLELLLKMEEGVPVTYHLQYGDEVASLHLGHTLQRFQAAKTVRFSTELPAITIDPAFISADPNLQQQPGNYTVRSPAFKARMLNWNLCVFKYIHCLDRFLMIEPDCVVLKHGWLRDIVNGSSTSALPMFGHLKKGRIEGRLVPTHWAGCSVYDGRMLRELELERYFYERYDNPWWPYRDRPDTTLANNCFWGPTFSGYDITYDYFLFALYWRHITGSNDPRDWPLADLADHSTLIRCDFNSRLPDDEVIKRYWQKLPLLHGIKSDAVREWALLLAGGCLAPEHRAAQSTSEQEPIVSIVTPVRNGAATLATAIASVQAQDFDAWEMLIVDDGSSDDTAAVAARAAAQDGRVRYLMGDGKGVAAARNTGLRAARGTFITFLDADDVYRQGALTGRVKALLANPDWDLVYCGTEVVGELLETLDWRIGSARDLTFVDMATFPLHVNAVMGRAAVIQRSPFEQGLDNGEDWLFVARLLRAGRTLQHVAEGGVCYRLSDSSTVLRDMSAHERNLERVIDWLYTADAIAAPEHRAALSTPHRLDLLRRRRVGLFVNMLLSERRDDAASLVDDVGRSSLTVAQLRNITKFAVSRWCRTHTDLWAQVLATRGQRAMVLARELDVAQRFPRFEEVLREVEEQQARAAMPQSSNRWVAALTRQHARFERLIQRVVRPTQWIRKRPP